MDQGKQIKVGGQDREKKIKRRNAVTVESLGSL